MEQALYVFAVLAVLLFATLIVASLVLRLLVAPAEAAETTPITSSLPMGIATTTPVRYTYGLRITLEETPTEDLQNALLALGIKHAVVWGHPLHSHTHSYVHHAFTRAFQAIGLSTVWANRDNPAEIPDHAIVVTEGQVTEGLPCNPNAFYVLHNVVEDITPDVFKLPDYNRVSLRTMIHKEEFAHIAPFGGTTGQRIADDGSVFLVWGTNLLPWEMTLDQEPVVPFNARDGTTVFVGTVGFVGEYLNSTEIVPFFDTASAAGFRQVWRGGSVSEEEHMSLIRNASLAPTIVGPWQKRYGYVPCRLFKNVSYGAFPCTNSETSAAMISATMYDADPASLAVKTMELLREHPEQAERRWRRAYSQVRAKHTYINNVHTIVESLRRRRPAATAIRPAQGTPWRIGHIGSMHNGCKRDVEAIAKHFGWQVTHINALTLGDTVPSSNQRYNVSQGVADQIWAASSERLAACDAWVITDTAPMARVVMNRDVQRPTMLWCCNRVDYSHQPSENMFPDAAWYSTLQESIRSGAVHFRPYTVFEAVHAVSKGVTLAEFQPVVRPIGEVVSPALALPSNPAFLVPPYHNDQLTEVALPTHGVPFQRRRYEGSADAAGFVGIIHIPYAWSNFALFEHWAYGVQYLVPSPEMFMSIMRKETTVPALPGFAPFFSPPFDATRVTAECEFYHRDNREVMIFFDSWEDCAVKCRALLEEPDAARMVRRRRIQDHSSAIRDLTLSYWDVAIGRQA